MHRASISLLSLVLFATTAFAAPKKDEAKPAGPDLDKLFQRLDADHDGKLTKEEYLKQLSLPGKPGERLRELMTKQFEKLDANSDGGVNAEEFKKFGGSFIPGNFDPGQIKKMIQSVDPEMVKKLLEEQFRTPDGGIKIDTDEIKKLIKSVDPDMLKRLLEQFKPEKPEKP